MAKLKATLTNGPTTFPPAGAPVPHEYRFELSGPFIEEKLVAYVGDTIVEALFSADPAPIGVYSVEAELLDTVGARIGDLRTAMFTVEAPPGEEIKITLTYPAGQGIKVELVEI